MLKHQKSNFVHYFCLFIFLLRHFRYSLPEILCKKCCPATLLEKETLVQVFSYEFCEISNNTPPYRKPPVAASGISRYGATKQSKIQIIVPT